MKAASSTTTSPSHARREGACGSETAAGGATVPPSTLASLIEDSHGSDLLRILTNYSCSRERSSTGWNTPRDTLLSDVDGAEVRVRGQEQTPAGRSAPPGAGAGPTWLHESIAPKLR